MTAAVAESSVDALGSRERTPVTLAVRKSLKRTHDLFAGNEELKRVEDSRGTAALLRLKMNDEYQHIRDVPEQVTDETVTA
ncbi:PLRG1, partial [Symbiodinium necroappetens]